MKVNRAKPAPGQESVWDYPRPPRVEAFSKGVVIVYGGITLAESRNARRVCETSHPPVYYIPQEDVRMEHLKREAHTSFCEWKGTAVYYTVSVGNQEATRAAWSYPEPSRGYESLKDCIAFYAGPMDGCFVEGERVVPQPGGFYGGWITRDIVGPFKGDPGTRHW